MLTKIKVNELLPNPYRKIKTYPIDQAKVEELKQSMNDTGIWLGIIARKAAKNGSYEMAFGHHRLEAIKQIGKKEVDVDIQKLDDFKMLKMMAHENMAERRNNTKVIIETVLSAKELIEKELKKEKQCQPVATLFTKKEYLTQAKNRGIGKRTLLKFLGDGWSKNITIALRTINDKQTDIEAVQTFEKPTHADVFRAETKEHKVPKEKQKDVAQEVHKRLEKQKQEVTSENIKNTMDDMFGGKKKKQKKEKPDINKMMLDKIELLGQVIMGLEECMEYREYIKAPIMKKFINEINIIKEITK